MFSLGPLSFPTKVRLFRGGRAAAISDTDNHVALPHFSQTPQCPHLYLTVSVFDSPGLTSGGLFPPVSYDVLWPCSGSTNSDTSIPAPSDLRASPCHMRRHCLPARR